MKVDAASVLAFVTGLGQSDTHAEILSDGRANLHPSAGTPYKTITAKQIGAMVMDPPTAPKAEAQWFIPSIYAGPDARSHDAQRTKGLFWWFAADIDKGDCSLAAVRAAADAVLGDVSHLIYSSRSSTPDDRKWRILVPLKAPTAGADYGETQLAFFDLLEAEGLTVDPVLARPAQLVYLPNRGAFYAHHIHRAIRLDLDGHTITERRDEDRRRRAEAETAAQARRDRRAAQRAARGAEREVEPIDHFNAGHTIEQLLGHYGFEQRRNTSDWRAPFQTTKSYALRDHGDYWVAISGSYAVAGIGSETRNGHRFGDAFDLFAFFDHGNDLTAAVRTYAKEAGLNVRHDPVMRLLRKIEREARHAGR